MRVSGRGKSFTPAPAGTHNAVCVDVVDLGAVDTNFGRKDMLRLMFEIEEKMDDGYPYLVGQRYTASIHPKSNLHKNLATWRNKSFTEEELDNFDLEKLVGMPCQILVQHNQGSDGNTYANIAAILPPVKGAKLKPCGKYERVCDRPDYEPPAHLTDEQGPPPGQDDESEPDATGDEDILF